MAAKGASKLTFCILCIYLYADKGNLFALDQYSYQFFSKWLVIWHHGTLYACSNIHVKIKGSAKCNFKKKDMERHLIMQATLPHDNVKYAQSWHMRV